jgi:hypothetical protein
MLGEARKAHIIYRSDSIHRRHRANFQKFYLLESLAKASTYISGLHGKSTLFYDWYSIPACAVHAF